MSDGRFAGAEASTRPGAWALIGCPFDGTVSFRPGARFGPEALRAASFGIESFSWEQGSDLERLGFADLGDLELPWGATEQVLKQIQGFARGVWHSGARTFALGGEHLITLPLVEAALEHHPELAVLQLDAHADLREDYLGQRLSHACVMRRVVERIGAERLVQLGIRSGTEDEREFARRHRTLCDPDRAGLESLRRRIGARPVYLTLDLDVLDPAFLPGTGTPEAGGWSPSELLAVLAGLEGLRVVAADVVELAPQLDASGCSAVTGAKLVRELLLRFGSAGTGT
jgi:agmatinase